MNIEDFGTHARRAATLLKVLGNDRRLLILCALVDGEKTVGDLEVLSGLRQSALSQHLARLRKEGLVATRRVAQHVHYRLVSGEAMAIIETLAAAYCQPPQGTPPPARSAESPPAAR